MLSEFLFLSYIRITAVVCLYWLVSIVTVFVNKTLLSSKEIDLDAPIFIVWYQCVVSVLICTSLKGLSVWFPDRIRLPSSAPFSQKVILNVLPLSILFTSMIGFNTLCLKYVGISFYYIGRSLTTVFNVIFTFFILRETVSCKAIACCAVIVTGFWMGVDQESVAGSLSTAGIFYGLLASMSLALYSIYTRKVLPSIGDHIWLLSYYVNIYSSIIFLPVMYFTGDLETFFNYKSIFQLRFWLLMTIGGLCGFSIGYVTSLQIRETSPLTHNVSGTAKACAQTVIATYWYDESKSWLWWLSNFIVLGGSAGYTSVKNKEMQLKYLSSKTIPL
ncbi:hypothetical protein AAG570_000265 [Ranatra chinensis]|uniref:Sugar phosphate transporter domain-containing protein n=1 Tax=Ranatra chinensis TaxID=642074 RepID=A0ABD0ZHS4_9HEMI